MAPGSAASWRLNSNFRNVYLFISMPISGNLMDFRKFMVILVIVLDEITSSLSRYLLWLYSYCTSIIITYSPCTLIERAPTSLESIPNNFIAIAMAALWNFMEMIGCDQVTTRKIEKPIVGKGWGGGVGGGYSLWSYNVDSALWYLYVGIIDAFAKSWFWLVLLLPVKYLTSWMLITPSLDIY